MQARIPLVLIIVSSLAIFAGLIVYLGSDITPVTGPEPSDDEITAPVRTVGPGAPGAPAADTKGAPEANSKGESASGSEVDFGATTPVFKRDNVFLAGQPAESDFKKIADSGVTRVISLCKEGEVSWDEKAAVEAAGMTFYHFPIGTPADLTDETMESIRSLLKEGSDQLTLLHCKGAVRAAAAWLPYRAVDQNAGVQAAVKDLETMRKLPESWLKPATDYATKLEQETTTDK